MKTITTVVIALCAGLNLAIGSIVYLLKFPIYLDMIGTLLCTFLLWPQRKKAFICATSAGILSLILSGLLVNPFLPWFSGTVIVVTAFSSFIIANHAEQFRRELPSSPRFYLPLIGYGLTTGVIAAIVSAPVVVYLFGGVTGSGSAMLVAFFVKTGNQLLKAAFLSGFTAEPIDKTIQLLLAIMLYRATPQSFIDLIREK